MKNRILLFILTLSVTLGFVVAFAKTSNALVIDDNGSDITNFLSGRKFNINLDKIDLLSFSSDMNTGSGIKFATITMYSDDPYDRGPFNYDVYVGSRDSYPLRYVGGGFLNYMSYSGGGSFSTQSINLSGNKSLVIEFSPNLSSFGVIYDYTLDDLLKVFSLYNDTAIEDALKQIIENPNYYGLYTQEQLEQEKSIAKQLGYNEGLENKDSLYNMILAVVDTPFRVFDNIFDFDILGINIKNIVLSFATVAIAIFVIKRFI